MDYSAVLGYICSNIQTRNVSQGMGYILLRRIYPLSGPQPSVLLEAILRHSVMSVLPSILQNSAALALPMV